MRLLIFVSSFFAANARVCSFPNEVKSAQELNECTVIHGNLVFAAGATGAVETPFRILNGTLTAEKTNLRKLPVLAVSQGSIKNNTELCGSALAGYRNISGLEVKDNCIRQKVKEVYDYSKIEEYKTWANKTGFPLDFEAQDLVLRGFGTTLLFLQFCMLLVLMYVQTNRIAELLESRLAVSSNRRSSEVVSTSIASAERPSTSIQKIRENGK